MMKDTVSFNKILILISCLYIEKNIKGWWGYNTLKFNRTFTGGKNDLWSINATGL